MEDGAEVGGDGEVAAVLQEHGGHRIRALGGLDGVERQRLALGPGRDRSRLPGRGSRGGDRRSPAVNPLHADLSGLPPTLVHVGSWELLRDDSITVVERINAVGGKAELKVWDGMCHSWQLWAPMLDEGMASIEEAGAFLRNQLN